MLPFGSERRDGGPQDGGSCCLGPLADGTKEQQFCEEEDGHQVSSFTAGTTGVVLRASRALFYSTFSPHADRLCLRLSPLSEPCPFPWTRRL